MPAGRRRCALPQTDTAKETIVKTRHALVATLALIAVLALAGLLASGCGLQATPTATPTKTPKPTFTATPSKTPTPAVTNTPTPVPPTNTPVPPTMTPTPKGTPTWPPASSAVMYVSAGGEGAYVRSAPDLQAKVKVWPDGTKVDALGKQGDWYYVRVPDNSTGFFPAAYLSASPPPPPAPTNTPLPAATATPSIHFRAIKGACVTHAGSTSVLGTVYQKGATGQTEGDLINGVWIHWWTDGWNGDWVQVGATSDGYGKYHSAAFGVRVVGGTWKVAVVTGQGSSATDSEIVTFSTSDNSDSGACNDQVVDFQSNW
jgi:hypothetical protein